MFDSNHFIVETDNIPELYRSGSVSISFQEDDYVYKDMCLTQYLSSLTQEGDNFDFRYAKSNVGLIASKSCGLISYSVFFLVGKSVWTPKIVCSGETFSSVEAVPDEHRNDHIEMSVSFTRNALLIEFHYSQNETMKRMIQRNIRIISDASLPNNH